jgi:hypothetical protein
MKKCRYLIVRLQILNYTRDRPCVASFRLVHGRHIKSLVKARFRPFIGICANKSNQLPAPLLPFTAGTVASEDHSETPMRGGHHHNPPNGKPSSKPGPRLFNKQLLHRKLPLRFERRAYPSISTNPNPTFRIDFCIRAINSEAKQGTRIDSTLNRKCK